MNELYVITVPALDWDGRWHTAFTVYSLADGVLRIDHDDAGNSYAVTETFRTEYETYTDSVEFAEGTVAIADHAVSSMPLLTSLTLPEGVLSIGEGAFSGGVGRLGETKAPSFDGEETGFTRSGASSGPRRLLVVSA